MISREGVRFGHLENIVVFLSKILFNNRKMKYFCTERDLINTCRIVFPPLPANKGVMALDTFKEEKKNCLLGLHNRITHFLLLQMFVYTREFHTPRDRHGMMAVTICVTVKTLGLVYIGVIIGKQFNHMTRGLILVYIGKQFNHMTGGLIFVYIGVITGKQFNHMTRGLILVYIGVITGKQFNHMTRGLIKSIIKLYNRNNQLVQ